MNREFKVIQGHSYWFQQKSRTSWLYNHGDIISKTYEDIARAKLQIRRFQPLNTDLTTVLLEKPSNVYKWFILPETLTYISAADSMGLSLLPFTQLFLEVESPESETASTNT